jgi:hypothetical protein
MLLTSFGSISPNEIDRYTFLFDKELGTATITSAVWTCTVSLDSPVIDLTPQSRIISHTVDNTIKSTSALIGTCVDRAIYIVTALVNVSDGRKLEKSADLACILRLSIEDELLTVEQFRAQFIAFADPVKYPDSQIAFWINQVLLNHPLDEVRWGQFYQLGLRLWVAHHLALQGAMNVSGSPLGPLIATSKSVNGVSVGYSSNLGLIEGGGPFNLTVYGTQFLWYARLVGAGPIQI